MKNLNISWPDILPRPGLSMIKCRFIQLSFRKVEISFSNNVTLITPSTSSITNDILDK